MRVARINPQKVEKEYYEIDFILRLRIKNTDSFDVHGFLQQHLGKVINEFNENGVGRHITVIGLGQTKE